MKDKTQNVKNILQISMAVCSVLYQLATRQEEQEKVYKELRKVIPDPSKNLTAADLDKLAYTKAFVKEVFRMYSTVIGNGRTLQQDMVIRGYQIPKGVKNSFLLAFLPMISNTK